MQPQQIAQDFTQRDFSHAMAGVAGSGQVRVSFSYDRITTTEGPQTRLKATKRIIGDKYTEVSEHLSEAVAAQLYPHEFAMFKSTGEMPISGTPLAELPGVSQSMIGYLMVHNIRSIEELAAIGPDAQIALSNREIARARVVADEWLKRKTGNADLTAAAAEKADLAARLADMERQLAEAKATAHAAEARAAVAERIATAGGSSQAVFSQGGAVAVESDVSFAGGEDVFAQGGGVATDNTDIAPDVTAADPLGLGTRRKG